MFDAASFNSDSSTDNPESRKMPVTPYFPKNISGFKILPFAPKDGNDFAAKTAAVILNRNPFLLANAANLLGNETCEGSAPPVFASAVRMHALPVFDFWMMSSVFVCC